MRNQRQKRPNLEVVDGLAGLEHDTEDLEGFIDPELDSVVEGVDGGTSSQRLKLRTDLRTKPGGPGTILVQKPESPHWLTVYEMEWKLAQLLDGRRTTADIAHEIVLRGLGATPKTVAAFLKELAGYGFLEGHQPGQPVETADTSDELDLLFRTALAFRARGSSQDAMNYLLAVLEIEPSHHEARDLLRQLQSDASAPARDAPSDSSGSMQRGRIWAVALGAAALVVVGVAALSIVRSPHARGGAKRAGADVGALQSNGNGEEPDASARVVDVPVALQAAKLQPLVAPTDGAVSDVLVAPNDDVQAGQAVIEIMNRRAFSRVARLRQKVARDQQRASSDTIFRFLLKNAKHKLERAMRRAAARTIRAPRRGRIEQVLVKKGTPVAAGTVLVQWVNPKKLAANIPRSAVAFRIGRCEIRAGAARFPCRVTSPTQNALGQQVLTVDVANPAGELHGGQWVRVELSAAKDSRSP